MPTNKSDAADARAICRAMQKTEMLFVGIPSEAQQAVQSFHRFRNRQMDNRTALLNLIRGILLEYGVAIPKGVASAHTALLLLLDKERWAPRLSEAKPLARPIRPTTISSQLCG